MVNPLIKAIGQAAKKPVKKGAEEAISKAAEAAGMKAPVVAQKDLTTLQDVHTSLGDRIRAEAEATRRMMEGFDYKYDKGQRVFTEDSAAKNRAPYEIIERTRVGNVPMREDHPSLGPGMGRPIIDPETGRARRTPYEPGYRVRSMSDEGDVYEFVIPASAVRGDVEFARGGKVHISSNPDTMRMELEERRMGVGGFLAKAAKGAQKAATPEVKAAQVARTSVDLERIKSGGLEIPSGGFTKEEKAALRPLYNQGLIRVEERGGKQVLVPGQGAWYEFATPQQKAVLDGLQKSQGVKDLSLMAPTESVLTSAQSSFYDFEIAPGVRNIPIKNFEPFLPGYESPSELKRIESLANQIKESKQIEPLFVGVDPTGEAYIMEGQHRIRALKSLGYDEIPAKVVIDMDDVGHAKGGEVHMQDGGAAFGVFPQMKPRRSGRTENADVAMLRGLSRGFVSGAAGAPGDAELLARILANTPGVQAYGEATAAGMPGKYRQGEVGLETRLPTSEDIERVLPFRPENPSALERAATGLGQIGGGFYTGPGAPIRAVTAIPNALFQGARDFVMAAGRPAAYMVKPKGVEGNWLTGSVEEKLSNIKVKYPHATYDEPEKNFAILVKDRGLEGAEESIKSGTYRYPLIREDMALNEWIDKTLGKYIKNEMGTPKDPVRLAIDKKFKEVEAKFEKDMARSERTAQRAAQETDPRRKGNLERQAQREAAAARQERQLASDNIYNTNAPEHEVVAADFQRRNAAKFSGPEYGKVLAETPAGKAWEDATDALIGTSPAATRLNFETQVKSSPWLKDLPPDTPIHHLAGGTRQIAGLDHVVDILRQDLAAGRLKPEDLKNLTVDRAILRAGEYDKELAIASREAQLKSTEGMPIHKEYPEQGMKWYELALGDLPPGYTREASGVYLSPTGERSLYHPNYGKLEEALKYEGDVLSHCVGGYCPRVISGESRIFSLRNEAGQPFATIEVAPGKPRSDYESMSAIYDKASAEANQLDFNTTAEWQSFYNDRVKQLQMEMLDKMSAEMPERIVQIKGFKNQAPDQSVLPLIQDFVRSGKWSDVGDLENTGLRFVGEGESTPGFAEWMKLRSLDKLPNVPPGYYTPQELLQFGETSGLKEAYPSVYEKWAKNLGVELPDGKKHGGRVHISDNPDTMRLELEDKKMQVGGFARMLGAGSKTAKGAQKAEAAAESIPGVHYADPLKPAEMRMSEALGNAGAEGKTLRFTESDRSRVFGPNRGGVGFAGLQHYSEPHKQANTVWGFGNKLTAEKKIRQNDPEKTVWTTFIGAPEQHKSNTVVIQDALKAFQEAAREGKVPPEQIKLMNQRLRAAADEKTGVPFFEKDFDITDPAALLKMTTFSRRSALGDVLMGEGSRGVMRSKEFQAKHGKKEFVDASKINELLKRETDPDLIGAGTYDVGNRLFIMDNGIVERPDLNVAFPWQVTGSDLGMKYQLVPKEAAMRDWMKQYEGRVGKTGKPAPVSYMDLARNNPSQFVDEDFLTFLQRSGYKKGGAVDDDDAISRSSDDQSAAFGVFPQMRPRRTVQDPEAAKNIPLDVVRGALAGALGTPADILNMPGAVYSAVTGEELYKLPYGSEYIEERLPFRSDTPTGRAFVDLGQLAGGLAMGRVITAAPQAVKTAAREIDLATRPKVTNVLVPDELPWNVGQGTYAVRNLRGKQGAKELENIKETGYMLPSAKEVASGKERKWFTLTDKPGKSHLRVKSENVPPNRAVRRRDIEVYDPKLDAYVPLKRGGVVKLAAGGLSKAAVEALTKMRGLSKEFAESSAQYSKYLQETKNVPTKELPSYEEWKALQINVTPQNIEQLRKETGNKRGGSIKKKR